MPKRSPGRQKIHADAAARQRAYRDRRKQVGLPADTRLATIESLRDELARMGASQAELDARRRQLDDREAALVEREAALTRTKPSDDRKIIDLELKVSRLELERQQWRFKKSDKLRELLGKRFMMPDRQLTAVFLIDYAGNPIERGYEFERATKAALEFGRKAAAAGGAIAEIVERLTRHQQLNDDEKAILDAARSILGNVHHQTTIIKERAKSDTQRVKREEIERRKAAEKAVVSAFPRLNDDSILLALYLLGGRRSFWGLSYHLDELGRIRPESVSNRDMNYHLEGLANEVRNELSSRIEAAIKAGQKDDESAQALAMGFTSVRTKIETENKALLDRINTCRVAVRLAEANKRPSAN